MGPTGVAITKATTLTFQQGNRRLAVGQHLALDQGSGHRGYCSLPVDHEP